MPHINASSDDRTNAIKLADRIATLLKSGINLSTSVVEYIDSTMAPASIDELTAILENRASSEAESLLDLLFFPDMGFQVQLEPLLERYPVNQTGCACLLDQLNRRNLATRFVFPDAGGQMVLEMPKSIVAPFVSRLNITRRLPLHLNKEIHQNVASGTIDTIKVILRNVRTPLSEIQTDFLCLFFKKSVVFGKDLISCLRTVLQIMDETNAGTPIYQALMEKKRALLRHLQDAIKFEERRRHHAMETLMLGGERAAHIHPADALHTIAFIDATAIAVYGSTEAMSSEPLSRHTGRFHQVDDLKTIMNMFAWDPPENEWD